MNAVNCSNCGAQSEPGFAFCWLCKAKLTPQDDSAPPAVPPPLPPAHLSPPPNEYSFGLSGLMLVVTLSAVFFGLFVAAPGLAILLAIPALPALIRTALVVNRRASLGRESSASERFALFFGSFGVSVVILLVVFVVGFGTFCAACLAMYSAGGEDESLIFLAAIAGLVALIPTTYGLSYWVRWRWRKDTTPQ